MTDRQLDSFYTIYNARFIISPYEKIISTLKSSKILTFDNEEVKFGYDYILYYLSAKKIADIIFKPEGKSIIKKLFDNVHINKNGSILVFITHHSKDISFIDDSLLNSMVVLSDYQPITLALDDPFYEHIKEIANDVSKDILELNKNPKQEREKQLKALDQQERRSTPIDEFSDTEGVMEQTDAKTLPFKRSFRSIEIVGQIIRNRKGSLEKSQLKDMITEVYTTGFRTISYSSQLLTSAKNQIILMLNDDNGIEGVGKNEIAKNVNDFVMMSSFETCLGVFTKIMNTMGIRDLKILFNEVASEINTPAATLVSFSINSYYGSVSEKELTKITSELNGNPVALKILRARMKSYVYSRNLDIKTKQKFAHLLGMSISPTKPNKK